MVIVVDDGIDPRETDHFMELVTALIDDTEARHEDTDIIPQLLDPLGEMSSC